MPLSLAGRVLLAMALAAARPAAEPRAEPTPLAGVPVARLAIVGDSVEQRTLAGDWQPAQDGSRLKTGDRLRTGRDAVARIEFPWTAVNVGPASTVWIPGSAVLSTVLEGGRVEVRSGAGEIIKLRTTDAQV